MTRPWDTAEHLDTPEEIAAYLEAAFEEGDPAFYAHALGVVARATRPASADRADQGKAPPPIP
jgi:probable addiction module antidote protein